MINEFINIFEGLNSAHGGFKKDKSNLYVTSGAGCWGPKMRLGTFNEIIIINLMPK